MRTERPEPVLKTAPEDFNEVEKTKLAGVRAGADGNAEVFGTLMDDFRDFAAGDVGHDTEALAKSHGIYLEYNRAKTGKEKDWMYMVRLSSPGGGPFTRKTWQVIDDISRRYCVAPGGKPGIRLTTRQNVQFHWVKKENLVKVVGEVAATGFLGLNGCGDNTRNIMACPLSRYSTVYNALAHAHEYGKYFELPAAPHIQIFAIDPNVTRFDGTNVHAKRDHAYDYGPQLLNRKFKIAFATVHRNPVTGEIERDNCVEALTNDMSVAPIVEHGKVVAFQAYIGGGQGEKNGKASSSMLGQPVAIFTPDNLMRGLHDIVKVHEEFGDRANRHWARLKYVVWSQGIPWYQDRLREKGATFELPDTTLDVGPRQMHHGWQQQESNGKLAYGLYVECGRLVDRDGSGRDDGSGATSTAGNAEKLQMLVKDVMEKFDVELLITPNQDALFTNIEPAQKDEFEAFIHDPKYSYGTRHGKPYSKLRLLSGACVGLPTCRLSYTDSEQFEPELIDQLEAMGYGDLPESIGITGCERQCFRPGTKSIGWVGQGPNLYMMKVGGDEAGRHQGIPINEGEKLYMRQVPRAQVATVCAVLFDNYLANKQPGEDLGAFHRRIGTAGVLKHLRENPKTAPLTAKGAPATFVPEAHQV
jgi:sulfite reductase beta subunit-like hemoprotein